MSKPNYRVIVTFDGERKLFVAHAPELEHCTAEGPTRAEAIARAEEEIDAQLANMLSHGSTPPRAVDEEQFSGEVTAKVSKTLHRDLAYQARNEGIELDQLVGELLSAAVESRRGTHRGPRTGNRQPNETIPHDNIGNRSDGGGGQRRGGFGGGRGYAPQILDDRANFIEYVRGLENGGYQQRGGGGPGGGGGPRNNNNNNNNNNDGGRRRRGRGGRNDGRPGQPHSNNNQFQNRNGNGQPQHSHEAHASAAASPAPSAATPPTGGSHDDGNA
jgi:predicted RNase H-like HicB family nuclease